jgi:hypothetical protein
MGKSIFSSPGATIHEGITSNRRGETQGIFVIEERGDAHLQSLCPRMQTTGAAPASRRRSWWGATIGARRRPRQGAVGAARRGAEELRGLPPEREQGRGGRPRSPPEGEQGRGGRGRAEAVRGRKASSPASVAAYSLAGAATSSSSGPEIDPPAAASSPNRGVMAAAELMWRERGGGASGSEGRSSGEGRSLGERTPAHGREQRSPTGQKVAAAQGKAVAPRLFPFHLLETAPFAFSRVHNADDANIVMLGLSNSTLNELPNTIPNPRTQ